MVCYLDQATLQHINFVTLTIRENPNDTCPGTTVHEKLELSTTIKKIHVHP